MWYSKKQGLLWNEGSDHKKNSQEKTFFGNNETIFQIVQLTFYRNFNLFKFSHKKWYVVLKKQGRFWNQSCDHK